MFHKVYYGPLI